MITESFAKKYFPNEDPIGQQLTFGFVHNTGGKNNDVTAGGRIVGIINDVHQQGLDRDPYPAAYVGWGTLGLNDIAFLVRPHGETRAVAGAIRERVRAVDPQMPVYDLRTMDDVVSESVSEPRFLYDTARGVCVARPAARPAARGLGVYGVISYAVSQRTREMGIRIALGATQDRVVRLIVGRGVRLAVAGIAIGLVGAFNLAGTLATLLYGVRANDLATYGAVGALLLGVAAVASYLPARRAAMVRLGSIRSSR